MPITPLQLNLVNRPIEMYVNTTNDDLFDLDTPYQRDLVWTDTERVALIKSLLMKLPIGTIYINVRDFDLPKPYAVIDGKQRIQALRDFRSNTFGVPAEWFFDNDLKEAIEGDTAYYRDLNRVGRNRITMATIATYEAHVATVEEEAEIFMLVNTGGVAQTLETIANARSYTKAGK